jgi:hypothetical protein
VQASELEALIADADQDQAIVAKMNFSSRLSSVRDEIRSLEEQDSRIGEIALLFNGAPVHGRRAIDAAFASNALSLFQGIVERLYSASIKGQLSSRGKIKGAELAGLDIVGLATGSFGFVLEEKQSAQFNAVKTAVRDAIDDTVKLLNEFSQDNDDEFLIEVDDMNPRVFQAVAKFYTHLNKNTATLKAELPDSRLEVSHAGVKRAVQRIELSQVEIDEVEWIGTLVGLSPIKRTFDFRERGSDTIVSGKFGLQVSQDYLERIENDNGITLGGKFRATVEVGTIRKPDGRISVSHTMTDLEPIIAE